MPILLFLIPLLAAVVGTIAFHYVEADLVAGSGEALALAAVEISDKLDRILFERYGDVQLLAAAPVFQGTDAEAMTQYLAAVKTAYPFYVWMGAVDRNGRVVASTDPSGVGQDRSSSRWFQAVRDGIPIHVQDAEFSSDAGGVRAVSFTAALRGRKGEFNGAVTTRVDLKVLEDVFARIARTLESQRGLSGKVEWQFLNRNGEVIVDSLLRQEGRTNLKDLGLPSAVLSFQGVPGYVEEQHLRRHVPVITGYARTEGYGTFPGLGWGVLVRMDRQEVVGHTRAVLWKLSIAGAMLWTLLFGLLLWSVFRLRREWLRASESEIAANASEERFRKTFHEAPIGMATVGTDYRFLQVNAALCGMLGYTEEDLVSRTFVDITHPEDVDMDVRLAERLFKGEIPGYDLEKRYVKKDGTFLRIRLTGTVMRDQDGKPLFGLAMIEDITEKKRAEERQAAQVAVSLVLSESASLKDAAPRVLQAVCATTEWELGLIWGVDDEAAQLRCETLWHRPSLNADEFVALSRATAFKPGVGLPGRVWASGEPAWIPDVVRDRNFPRAPAASKSGLHGAFGFPVKGRAGVLGVVEFFSREIREPDTSLLTMMADVGLKIGAFVDRRQAEEAAQASEERFRLAIDSASDAILYLDRHDVIVWANHQAFLITGQALDRLVGSSLMGAFSTQPMAKAQLASIGLGRPVPPLVEFEVFLRDGTSRWVEVTIANVRKGEEVVGWLLVARDRTERRQIERQLRQSEKMASLGLLLDGVAHELNNPLFMVSGFVQLAAEKLKSGQYDTLADDLASISGAARRATEILQRTLAVARHAKGGGEPCQINALVRQTLDLMAATLEGDKIALRIRFQPDLPQIMANPLDLSQVFLNLITNALRAMATAHGRGTLTVATARIAHEPKDWVELRVMDDGSGIAAEFQSRIFEPFSTARQGSQGTGLSLAIGHRIVTDLGGTLTMESRPGQGAVFIVRLPAM